MKFDHERGRPKMLSEVKAEGFHSIIEILEEVEKFMQIHNLLFTTLKME